MLPERGLFVVADGMGGHAAGEVASEMAVRIMARELGDPTTRTDGELAEGMRLAIQKANAAIFERTLTEHDKRGMGTTATALILAGGGGGPGPRAGRPRDPPLFPTTVL